MWIGQYVSNFYRLYLSIIIDLNLNFIERINVIDILFIVYGCYVNQFILYKSFSHLSHQSVLHHYLPYKSIPSPSSLAPDS